MDATGDQNSDYAPDCKYCLQRLNANRVVPNIILPPDHAKILGHKTATDEFDIKKCPYCGKMVLSTVLLEHQLRCVYDLYEPDNYMCDACRESGFMEFHNEEEQMEMAMELSEFQQRRKKFVELLHEVPVPNEFEESSALPRRKRKIEVIVIDDDDDDDDNNNEDLPQLPNKKSKIANRKSTDEDRQSKKSKSSPEPSPTGAVSQVSDLPESQPGLLRKPQCTRKRDASGRFIREGPVPRPTKKGNNKRPTEVEKLTSSTWLGVGRDINISK